MKKIWLVLLLALSVSAVPSPAWAGCFEDLGACFQRAATRDSWVSRWLAGLDCELDFVECTREKIIGN
jgi:hypothetical protein